MYNKANLEFIDAPKSFSLGRSCQKSSIFD